MRVSPAALLLLAGLLGAAGPARAQDCDVAVGFVDFGRLDLRDGGRVTGEVQVLCARPMRFRLSLSPGLGDYHERQMRGPDGRRLRYNIYLDPAGRQVWGDGLSAGTGRLVGRNDGRRHTILPIYARVPGGQERAAGHYTDALVVFVEPPGGRD